MWYRFAADVILVAHLAFVLFVVLGALVLVVNAAIYVAVWRRARRRATG